VRTNVANAAEVSKIYEELATRALSLNAAARVEGILVQEQIKGGIEMIIGLVHDPLFGPALTVGAGGIFAEVAKDFVVSPLPVDAEDVEDMVGRLRMAPLLSGVRGMKPVNRTALIQAILSVARLGEAAGSRLMELDVNPLIVLADRVVAVDALAVAGGSKQ